jgi:hypothetical protein
MAIEESKKYWEVRIPSNYRQARNSPQWEKWHHACLKQLDKIRSKNAYELVTPPTDNVEILPGKWVFDLKSDAEGNILEYRARWVVCGNFQEKDNSERYAPVASDASVKIFLTKVAREDMELRQIDIVSAYLNAALKNRKIFIRQPTGYEEGNKSDAWLLLQALYGLRESACLWYKTFDKKLHECGFVPLLEDLCVYMREKDGSMLILHVDDCLIAATSNEVIEDIVKVLHDSFGVKDLGEPSRFLGCNLHRNREKKTITMSQIPYITDALTKSAMQFCSGNTLPLHPGWKAEKTDPETANDQRTEDFITITGSCNWLATRTRPDITLATGKLQRQSSAPSERDLRAAKGILRFLKSHARYGIILNRDPSQDLVLYTDAAHQDNPDGKSTESHIIMYGGAPMLWHSKKQTFVAPSSTLAEFCAYDAAIKNAIWIRKLLSAFGLYDLNKPIPLLTDSNNGTIISKQCKTNKTVRWIDNRYFFIRDAYEKGVVRFQHIDGKENPADGLTKALDERNFKLFQQRIGVKELDIEITGTTSSEDETEI